MELIEPLNFILGPLFENAFYFVVSCFMAIAMIIDIGYRGTSYADKFFVNMLLFVPCMVLWPFLVVFIYIYKFWKMFKRQRW